MRYRSRGDLDALATVFDRTAPQLERLARTLTRTHAEDVVQETYLNAIEHSASWDAGRPLVPWLLGILTNRVQQVWRLEGRQYDPERMVAREPIQPEECLAYMELLEQLEHALESLSPGLRQAVSGALFDNQTPTQLAVELGLSPGTLRQRLHRGLSRLRLSLKSALLWVIGLFGLRSNGLAALRDNVLQFAAKSSPSGVSGWTTASVGSRWGAWLGLAALLSWAGIVLWKGEETSTKVSSGPALSPLQQAKASSEGVAPELGSPLLKASSATRQSVASEPKLEVRVTWRGNGLPAGGHPVRLMLAGGEQRQRITDAHGYTSFAIAANEQPLSVAADPTPQSPRVTRPLYRVKLDEPQHLSVHRGGSVSGQVLGPDEDPIPFATVLGWCGSGLDETADREVLADTKGRFVVEGLGERFALLAHSPEFVGAQGLRGNVQEGQRLEGHVLRVAPPGKMAGQALLPNGDRAVGVELWISHDVGSHSVIHQTHDADVARFYAGAGKAISDAKGWFEIDSLPPGRHRLRAKLAPYLVYSELHALLPDQVTVQLDAGESLRGRVVDHQGRPVLDAQISHWPFYGNVHTIKSWSSVDPQTGRFELRGILPVEQPHGIVNNRGLIVRAPGHSIHAYDSLPDDLSEIEPMQIRLLPEKTIEGVVRKADGSPASGIAVRIEGDRQLDLGFTSSTPHTWEKRAGCNETWTNAEGKFLFDRLYSGQFKVQVFADRTREQSLTQVTRSGSAPLEFQLTPEALCKVVLQVSVVDILTGQPIDDFELQHIVGSTGFHRNLVRIDGGWETSGIEAGEFGLRVTAEGYAPKRVQPKHWAEGVHRLALSLWPARTVKVLPLNQNGDWVRGVMVSGSGPDGNPIAFSVPGGSVTSHVQLEERSPFLHGLPAGAVSLHFESDKGHADLQLDLSKPLLEAVEVRITEAIEIQAELYIWELIAAEDLVPGESPDHPSQIANPCRRRP